jgi:1-acyl-sn-glycerol-3-phosphate acyltransferase
MSEADRPDGDGPPHDGGDGASRLRVFRGGRARTPRARPTSPREVARRLSALERRVEHALGATAAQSFTPDLRALADRTLAAIASARRLSLDDVRSFGEMLERDLTEALLRVLYRQWWRTEAVGLEHVPADGPVVIVANRGGSLVPYESLMIRVGLGDERSARPVVDDWMAQLPVLGPALARSGGVRGTPATVRRLLTRDEAVIVCPEGGYPKPFRYRYRLASFGRGTFARLAIERGAPIVPVAVIGAEEIHPVLARVDVAGRFLGLPTLPITPTFPWLGLAGLVPLPTKWLLLAGEPLDVAARHGPEAADDSAAVGRVRDAVRERLQALVLEGLRRRRSVFR